METETITSSVRDGGYFERPEVSNSDLTKIKHELSGGHGNDPYDAFRIGTLVDAIITEPDALDPYARTIREYKYTRKEIQNAEKMRDKFYEDPFCSEFVKGASFQEIMIRDMEIKYAGQSFVLPVRCKWDIWKQSYGMGGDIKSTTATTLRQFEAAVEHFDYDRSRAFYMDIAGSTHDVIIGISKKNFKIFRIPVIKGGALYNRGKEKYSYLAWKYKMMFA
ncbi:MAG: hypothetical protein A2W93_14420 [Bacteroidetes bacterium GWF2_43_63]|nr:MAG: hypothetical protein A2W94_00990 [Bacteroidetes bacterium GWE2_42_42]OFY52535.1 MAG: hypothetical protein A2W93_14420 [Bacteroidetes bacterium GWF2_43_63]HBG71443.1 hypothetical protein [Bacteroidales bacterium]HCB60805.1 hypothetical protein [Bacteroidales bacterium]HCY23470.1 hypothetical protein [Bacteroidales bacterium]